jgi:hypothetical protein
MEQMHLYMDVRKFEIARRVFWTSDRFFKICLVTHRYVFLLLKWNFDRIFFEDVLMEKYGINA